MEIRPLRDNFASSPFIDHFCDKEINISLGKSHLIKRSFQLFADSTVNNLDKFKVKQRNVRNAEGKLTIELGVFFDEAAYRTFMPFLDEDENSLRMLILAYVNHIQTLFHDPTLGVPIDISLVYLEIMKKQQFYIPKNYDDNYDHKLLFLFCNYAKTRNPPDDNDPRHWDIALYLTGIDIYYKDGNSIGISFKNVCSLNEACSVVEFGIPYTITSGFSSALTAAHEIGHV